jgi:hypothetical protein
MSSHSTRCLLKANQSNYDCPKFDTGTFLLLAASSACLTNVVPSSVTCCRTCHQKPLRSSYWMSTYVFYRNSFMITSEFLVSQTAKPEIASSSRIWIASYLTKNGSYRFQAPWNPAEQTVHPGKVLHLWRSNPISLQMCTTEVLQLWQPHSYEATLITVDIQ